MSILKLEFNLFSLVHSNIADSNREIMKIQYYPTPEIKEHLRVFHENIIVPILLHFKASQGYELRCDSGYRCNLLNNHKDVGGSKTSDHLKGYAGDLKLYYNGVKINEELFDFCQKNLKFKELIDERHYKWVHISFVPGDLNQEILHLK